jgi:hypothetical protein
MFNRRILPLQLQDTPMWEHKSGDAGAMVNFFHSSLAGMWTRLFKLSKDKIPKEGEDLGFEVSYDAPQVSI